ncbi:MAG: hypothetical protein LBK71_00670 [Verrucomicrobiales bacterium]|jgi:hypothetical protein|nr:hypothetical protein [Verrucomicrobiales bacterium]
MPQTPDNSISSTQLRNLAVGVRAIAIIIALFFGYLNVSISFRIFAFAGIFRDMSGGRPLPPLAGFIVNHQDWLPLVAIALPLIAIGSAIFIKNHRWALLGVAVSLCLILSQFYFTVRGLYAPLIDMLQQMQGP